MGKAPFSRSRTHEADVIVLGAGFAGVSAAREVTRAGFSALILEANDRIGGRTWTTDRFDTYVELGGTDIHWLQPHVWAELSRYGLEIEEFTPPTYVVTLENGTVREIGMDGLVELMDGGMKKLSDKARTAFERPYDVKFNYKEVSEIDKLSLGEVADGFGMSESERIAFESFWAAAYQGPLHKGSLTLALRWMALGSWDWVTMLDFISRYKFKGGTRTLIEAMFKESRASIRYNSAVSKVEETDQGVLVTLRDGSTVSGRAVVCAIPLNVLPEVEFIPSLPKNVETLIDQGQMSGGIKVVMKVKGNRDPYMALAAADSQFVLCQYDRELEDGNHLTTAFGPDASIIDGDDVQAVQEAMRQWFPDIEVLETAHFSWTNDPNFKGTWAVPTPGQMDSLLEIADIKGKIVFAGADIAKGNYALIDGAIDSGMQAGRSVSELLSSTEASAISNSASLKKDSVDRLWNQVHGSVISEHHS